MIYGIINFFIYLIHWSDLSVQASISLGLGRASSLTAWLIRQKAGFPVSCFAAETGQRALGGRTKPPVDSFQLTGSAFFLPISATSGEWAQCTMPPLHSFGD